jgi:hypothetical protein
VCGLCEERKKQAKASRKAKAEGFRESRRRLQGRGRLRGGEGKQIGRKQKAGGTKQNHQPNRGSWELGRDALK